MIRQYLAPDSFKSPCCNLPLIHVEVKRDHLNHYRCSECHEYWVWEVDKWIPCTNPEKHVVQFQRRIIHVH